MPAPASFMDSLWPPTFSSHGRPASQPFNQWTSNTMKAPCPIRSPFALAVGFLLVAAAACMPSDDGAENGAPESEEDLVARARGIHERVITLDTHADINTDNFTADRNYAMDLPTQVTLPRMEAGGLDVAWLVVYTRQGELTDEGYAAAYDNAGDKFDAIHRLAEEIAPDRIELAYTSDDVRRIAATGKRVAMIGVENAYPAGLDLARFEEFHSRGARYVSLSHNGHSQFSDSHTGEADGEWLHGGLSDLGRQAVAELNRLGMLIDISHPSKAAIMETIALSRAPVIASHSSARALTDHSRNLDDEQLRAVAENGGVVQTVALDAYVRGESETASVSDLVDHVDYMVNLIGIEHVGISSDFDGGGGIEGWQDASETFNVTLELVRRGYSEEEIAQIWSGNLLRALDRAQEVAAEMQGEN